MRIVPPEEQTREEWRPGVQTLLRVSAATGAQSLCLIEQWHAPGRGAPLHTHHGVEEVLVVLEGTAEFAVEGERAIVEAGGVIVVPPHARHEFRNVGDGVLHVLAALADGAPPVEYLEDETGVLAIGVQTDAPHRTPAGGA